MKLFKIEIENYRMLKSFRLEIEEELSLVIGKNNSGKTSILSALDKFLNQSEKKKFYFNDFNIAFNKELKQMIEGAAEFEEKDFSQLGIKLKLFIAYNEKDDLSNVSRVMMDLDPDNNVIVLGFEYILDFTNYQRARADYLNFKKHEEEKKAKLGAYIVKGVHDFLKEDQALYFFISRKSFAYNKDTGEVDESKCINLKDEEIGIKDIINFKFISAKRDVTNREIDTTLSVQTSKIYQRTEATEEQNEAVGKFKDRLSETDTQLTGIYKDLFAQITAKVKLFGGVKPNESDIEIVSTLQQRELLEGNTTVVYKHDADNKLPEHYNGLGYMNLISMIFEIEILVQEFKKRKGEKLADINLLFIEEPEAHTHPQMQYIFIKNIKLLLKEGIKREDGESRKLQYIITSHSSHIVADSDFNDIKYLKNEGDKGVQAKNLKDLEKEYVKDGQEGNFRFLTQYLTLNRAELFFADKAIFIEGDTERILLPAMMRKVDLEFTDNPLLSQNISRVEVGAHSHIFEKFIDFIGIQKCLIISDIDSYYQKPELEVDGVTPIKYKNGNPVFETIRCPASDVNAQYTSNNALIFFHDKKTDVNYFKALTLDWKILRKNKQKKWVPNRKGNLLLAYQTDENGYCARSFEDAFFNSNKPFIIDADNSFLSLTPKWLEKYKDGEIETFEFSEKGVENKPSLAIEILLNSKPDKDGKDFSNWNIPAYIKEGLVWLMND